MKTAQEWLDEPSYAAWTATADDIEAIQADAQAELRAELTRWQNAFAMFKGSPEELAQWAVRDANERISQAQIQKILAVPDQLSFPILRIWKSPDIWVASLETDNGPRSGYGPTLREALTKLSF